MVKVLESKGLNMSPPFSVPFSVPFSNLVGPTLIHSCCCKPNHWCSNLLCSHSTCQQRDGCWHLLMVALAVDFASESMSNNEKRSQNEQKEYVYIIYSIYIWSSWDFLTSHSIGSWQMGQSGSSWKLLALSGRWRQSVQASHWPRWPSLWKCVKDASAMAAIISFVHFVNFFCSLWFDFKVRRSFRISQILQDLPWFETYHHVSSCIIYCQVCTERTAGTICCLDAKGTAVKATSGRQNPTAKAASDAQIW